MRTLLPGRLKTPSLSTRNSSGARVKMPYAAASKSLSRETDGTIKVCASDSESDAALLKTLQRKITDSVQDVVAGMSKEMEYRSKETHERIGYGVTSLNCSKCPD